MMNILTGKIYLYHLQTAKTNFYVKYKQFGPNIYPCGTPQITFNTSE